MQIGIIRETKMPIDRRVPLIPTQVKELSRRHPEHEFVVQKSDIRAYQNKEYANIGIKMVDDVNSCDILLGVKEVDKEMLIPGKTYLFFSHTAKLQPYNQSLLQEASRKKITLVDYEYLKANKERVVAFGYWAGIVGAYEAMLGIGLQNSDHIMKPAVQCVDLQDMKNELKKSKLLEPIKIVVTGEGRVASGAIEMLEAARIERVSPASFIDRSTDKTVYCQIGPQHYTKHKAGKEFDFKEFISTPQNFISTFYPFAKVSDVFIACHFWDPKSPVFFTLDQMQNKDFRIRFIADISCDIDGPIPTTVRASNLEKPFYGINRLTGEEIDPFNKSEITVMAVDNLPGGIPRDASEDFGNGLMKSVLPELLLKQPGEIIRQATILDKGKLTEPFSYLEDYLKGN
jgi:alanine dehydrogenase